MFAKVGAGADDRPLRPTFEAKGTIKVPAFYLPQQLLLDIDRKGYECGHGA